MSVRVLHLGLGRFHRAHQAVYYQRLKDDFAVDSWTVAAFSMRTTDARDKMRAAGLKYPVVETSRKDVVTRWIDRIQDVGTMGEDREKFLGFMTDPQLKFVTLTVTEKGYCLDVNGNLDLSHPDVKADLADPSNPKSAIGWLALGLEHRYAKELPALIVLSCDNLRSNGTTLARASLTYASEAKFQKAKDALASKVKFPNTMVDRIVPALSGDVKKKIEAAAGLTHEELVATESFSQWVIEARDLESELLPLARVGVEIVSDIRPYEAMKLRILNAAHSFLAYAGLLRGHSYVHEAIGDPELRQWVRELIFDEAGPMLRLDVDWKSYGEKVIERFENPRLPHSLQQIAADGSLKIPQRILPTIEESIRSHKESPAADMAVASWIAFLHLELGPDGGHKVNDPVVSRLKGLWHPEFSKWLKTLAADRGLFGALADDPTWHERLARAND